MFEKIFNNFRESKIPLIAVDLGAIETQIPVFEMAGSENGPTVLITAGMDGDEYAGIEAAYTLIREVKQAQNFVGRIIIIPIVNTTGFEGECSQCPFDGKYPKNIFPGNVEGSATDRLIHWLYSKYITRADIWYDMHAGAITEGLNPFLWLYKTGNDAVDCVAERIIDAKIAKNILFETATWGSMQRRLAKEACVYICAEAGGRGNRDAEAVEQHLNWAHLVLAEYTQMTDIKWSKVLESQIFYDTAYIIAPFDGIWRPAALISDGFKQGDLVGVVSKIDGTHEKEIYAAASGASLWWKETMQIREGDVLLALGKLE